MTLQQLSSLAEAYKAEACKPLKIDPKKVVIKYQVLTGLPIVFPGRYNPSAQFIELNLNFLKKIDINRTPTALRAFIYTAVYEHYLRSLKGVLSNMSDQDIMAESTAYCEALCAVKGLHQKIPNSFPLFGITDIRKRTLRILKEVFGYECCFRKVVNATDPAE